MTTLLLYSNLIIKSVDRPWVGISTLFNMSHKGVFWSARKSRQKEAESDSPRSGIAAVPPENIPPPPLACQRKTADTFLTWGSVNATPGWVANPSVDNGVAQFCYPLFFPLTLFLDLLRYYYPWKLRFIKSATVSRRSPKGRRWTIRLRSSLLLGASAW